LQRERGGEAAGKPESRSFNWGKRRSSKGLQGGGADTKPGGGGTATKGKRKNFTKICGGTSEEGKLGKKRQESLFIGKIRKNRTKMTERGSRRGKLQERPGLHGTNCELTHCARGGKKRGEARKTPSNIVSRKEKKGGK